MASLAQLPELVGFFSYSREDDEAFKGSLSALRDAIARELGAQLGRTRRNFRLWQDQEAIAPGKDWEAEITRAVEQSAFFIPIVTPRAVGSDYCKFEFASFVAREGALGRGDLVFPILWISVPALLEETQWRADPVLSIVAKRQYVDWRPFRYAAVDSPAFGQAIERFCGKVVETLREPWLSPEERLRQEAEARRRAEEEERLRLEAEAKGRAEEEERLRREAEAKKRAEEEVRRRKEADAQRRLAEEERLRQASEGKKRAEEERRTQNERTPEVAEARRRAKSDIAQLADAGEQETQQQLAKPWRPSRRDGLITGVLVAAMAVGAAAWWNQHRLNEEVHPLTKVTAPARAAQPQTTVAAPAPAAQPQTKVAVPGPAAQPQTTVAAPAPAAQPQTTVAAPAPAAQPQTAVTGPASEKEESHALTNATALTAARERALKAGDAFKECKDCPEMIVVPAGRFLMGSPAGQGHDDERPAHEVTIANPFAAAKFPLTFDEWEACAAQGGCRRDVSDNGWGRGRRPAINVSWDDAQAYVKWLSGITGAQYQLLSETEYEYVARAGSQTAYPWGDEIKPKGPTAMAAAANGTASKRRRSAHTARTLLVSTT